MTFYTTITVNPFVWAIGKNRAVKPIYFGKQSLLGFGWFGIKVATFHPIDWKVIQKRKEKRMHVYYFNKGGKFGFFFKKRTPIWEGP